MKYSRKSIDKAGIILLTSKDGAEVQSAIAMIDDWRLNHLPVLERLCDELANLFLVNGVSYMFYSQRLKRMTSILDKLDKAENMRLGGLNDIGGLRFVFADIKSALRAVKMVKNAELDGFELLNEVDKYNYILHPAPSGYRSVHLVFKYSSDDERYDGLRVELQLRTKLQHNWATAVESGEIITRRALKNSQGPEGWLKFFRIASALFSLKEGSPVLDEYKELGENDLCKELALVNEESNCIDLLKAFRAALNFIENKAYNAEYYVISVDYEKRAVNVYGFSKEEQEASSQKYTDLENRIENQRNAVLLVSTSSLKELREAYPSYFIDATEFLDEIDSDLCH